NTGEVRWRYDRLRYDIVGQITGTIHPDLPTDPLQIKPFAWEMVTVGANTVAADASGVYDAPASGLVNVQSAIGGLYCYATRADALDASFSATVQDPGLAHIDWRDTNSHVAERDGYYHVTRVHDHVKALDAGFTGDDYSMPCTVNLDSFCN